MTAIIAYVPGEETTNIPLDLRSYSGASTTLTGILFTKTSHLVRLFLCPSLLLHLVHLRQTPSLCRHICHPWCAHSSTGLMVLDIHPCTTHQHTTWAVKAITTTKMNFSIFSYTNAVRMPTQDAHVSDTNLDITQRFLKLQLLTDEHSLA